MSRILNLGVAQLGPIARDEPRSSATSRMIELMRDAHSRSVNLLVFPELALTSFFTVSNTHLTLPTSALV